MVADPRQVHYFFGRISREDANMILERHGSKVGSFLLRSGLMGEYAFSLVEQQKVTHFRINQTNSGLFYMGDSPFLFQGPVEAVEYFRTHSHELKMTVTAPCSRGEHFPSVYFGVDEREMNGWIVTKMKASFPELGCQTACEVLARFAQLNKKVSQKLVTKILREQQEQQPWYFSQVHSREDAERIILDAAGGEEGVFLIRPCKSGAGSNVLSLHIGNRVAHFLIQIDKQKKYFIGSSEPMFFDSLIQLVDYYHMQRGGVLGDGKLLLKPCIHPGYQFQFSKPNILASLANLHCPNSKERISVAASKAAEESYYSSPANDKSSTSIFGCNSTNEHPSCDLYARRSQTKYCLMDSPTNTTRCARTKNTDYNAVTAEACDPALPERKRSTETNSNSGPNDTSDLEDRLYENHDAFDAVYASTKFTIVKQSDLVTTGELGTGNYSSVFAGYWRREDLEMPVAVKIVDCDDIFTKATILREAKLMSELRHENIVRMLGFCDEGARVSIVLELMQKGCLKLHLVTLRERRAQVNLASLLRWTRGIASAMQYLEKLKIIHRDLAARNVLLSSSFDCKISDFFLSRNLDETGLYQRQSNVSLPVKWNAIESLEYGMFTTKSDVWSFGVTMWEIFSLCRPPYGRELKRLNTSKESFQDELLRLLKSGTRLSQPKLCPDEMYQIMQDCWLEDPELRPKFSQLHSRLSGYCLQ